METLLIYILKVSGILSLFYLTYQLFLKQETFYAVNRHFLFVGIVASLLLPFVTITHYIELSTIPIHSLSGNDTSITMEQQAQGLHWTHLVFAIYLLGLLMHGTKFIAQVLSLAKMITSNSIVADGRFRYVEMNGPIAPFSFFNYIFYNPRLYSPNELSAIIQHEKAHSSQWHSLDVLLSQAITIVTWMNPFSWLYQSNIKQNLEFLADAEATKEIPSIKNYQYTLLKVSGNQLYVPIVNNFYNSLIKKRIVMLNKSKSNKRNMLKIAFILPALALFLVSFNTKEVYVPAKTTLDTPSTSVQNSQLIEIRIDKNTTDKELRALKKDLSKKGIDFSYTAVHNSKKEIIEISVDFATTNEDGNITRSSSSFSNEEEGIDPIHIIYDKGTNSISMGSKDGMHSKIKKNVRIEVDEDDDKMIWVEADGDGVDDVEHKTIEIIDENGKETIKVNGKEVSRKEFDKMKKEDGLHEKHIKIKKSKGDKDENIFIMKMSDENEDIDMDMDMDMDNIILEDDDDQKMFIMKSGGKEKPLFIIDGKEVKEKEMKELDPSGIESVNVLKGEMGKTIYGEKGKNGVVLITLKKE
ncbi:MAG: M56 family metallopeptidase [Maribacter sp.]|uniref:M56 family metallopeptidase n=1 Tax=Maribacter sp. TaxID=1897614 RepID=UPI003C737336